MITGSDDGQLFGAQLAFGDLTGDGTDDLVVAAPYATPDVSYAGGVWIVPGGGL